MAELLIYNKEHWMDKLTPNQIKGYIKKYPNFQAKYDRRYQKGDIVDVKEDGFFTKTLSSNNKYPFRIVIIPNLVVDKEYPREYKIMANDGMITTRDNLQSALLTPKSEEI